MSDAFDPFHRWLGIPPKDQPPHHYRLLGIDLFESDPGVIESAADRQMSHVRSFQSGPHSRQSQEMLNLLSSAKICLLNPQKKAVYDQSLHARESAASQPPSQPSQHTSPATITSVQPAAPTGASHAAYNLAPQTTPAPAYQPPVYQNAWNNPPPVPTANPPRPVRMPNLGLVAAAAGLAIVLCGIMGSVVWWRLNALEEQRLAAKRTSLEPPKQQPATKAIQPATPEPPRKQPTPTVNKVYVPVPSPVQVRVQPVPFVPTPAPTQFPPARPTPMMRPTPSPFVEVPQISPAATTIRPQLLPPQALPPPLQNIHSGLTHWWGLHEVAGVRHDSVGLKDLADQRRVGSAMGIVGTCASFNGNQHLQADSDPTLQLRSNKSFTMWVKFSTMNTTRGLHGSQIMLGKWSGNSGNDFVIGYHYIHVKPKRFEFLVWEAAARSYRAVYSTLSDAAVNTWYFVVCQYDADRSVVAISVNDSPFDMMNVGPLRTSNNPLFVGADHGPPWNTLYGDLALVGIWDRLLSSDEITALYNQGRGVDLEQTDVAK